MEQIFEGVFLFANDDEGYNKWITDNQNGFVVNTLKKPNPKYIKTHRATCPTISRLQNGYTSFTNGYRKYCSTDLENLKAWAANEVKCNLQLCLKCLK